MATVKSITLSIDNGSLPSGSYRYLVAKSVVKQFTTVEECLVFEGRYKGKKFTSWHWNEGSNKDQVIRHMVRIAALWDGASTMDPKTFIQKVENKFGKEFGDSVWHAYRFGRKPQPVNDKRLLKCWSNWGKS
jgi:hypothetical protein